MSTMIFDRDRRGGETGQQRPNVERPPPVCVQPEHAAETPFRRPSPEDLSASIPVFFIGRNKDGYWVVRGADGKSGGLFWRKQSAIRFAARNAWPARCATIFPSGTVELDLENRGNPLLPHGVVTRLLRRMNPSATAGS